MVATKTIKERPILFSGSMVNAISEGRKTQTRRVIKMQPPSGYEIAPYCTGNPELGWSHYVRRSGVWNSYERFACPYGIVGDRLWVRETFTQRWDDAKHQFDGFLYRADGQHVVHVDGGENADGSERSPWKPSIFMPREACRTKLEITNVRVEQLQSITDDDAKAEGIEGPFYEDGDGTTFDYWKDYSGGNNYCTPRGSFRTLWDKINGKKHPWSSNPWLWVAEFKKI